MNIHEYQAKQVLAKFGAPISKGVPILDTADIDAATDALPGLTLPLLGEQPKLTGSSAQAGQRRRRPA